MKHSANCSDKWTLVDWGRDLISTASLLKLESVVNDLPNLVEPSNTIVDLCAPNGDVLSVGIALPYSDDNPTLSEAMACVNYAAHDRDRPFLTVVGDPDLDFENGGVVVFQYEQGTWSEMLKRNCVSVETMRRIIAHFFEHRLLPDWIKWEQV